MLAVIHPGWLLLFICGIVLLLVGCTAFPTRVPTQSSTPYPLVTLTTYPFATESPQPRSTQPELTTQPVPRTPNWLINRTASASPPDGPYAEQPTCYDSPNQQILCLGRIWNQTQTTIQNVSIQLTYHTHPDQENPQVHLITPEQNRIPPNSFAPYRVMLPAIARTSLMAQVTAYDNAPQFRLPIQVKASRGVLTASGRYVLTVNLHNTSTTTIEQVRLYITLFDEDEHVVGYRVYVLPEAFPAESERITRLEIIPVMMDTVLYHSLYIDVEPQPQVNIYPENYE